MSEQHPFETTSEKKQHLLALFTRLLPLVDSVADKLRFVLIVGVLTLIWIGIWLGVIKHFSLLVSLSIVGLAAVPVLILLRFWWSLEELKDLPTIAGQMMGDAKDEIRESVQGIRADKVSKLSFLSATKGLWSVGFMLRETRELVGSYISISTLINPFMLVLGVISLGFVFVLGLVSIVLVFLAL
nr:ABC transporter ATP-binding protein [Crenothrix polyspora]